MSRVVRLPPDEKPQPNGIKAGGWWHESEDGRRVICDLCPRGCSLAENARGFCFVRQNHQGSVVSTTYGRSTGFCIDPIEKKPLNQFYPGTAILSFGTAGCNLGCKFCQNWSSSRSRQVDAGCDVADPEAIARAAKQLACRSVAFTYNDPIVWAEYAIDTARACYNLGIKTVAVTNGYITPLARTAFFEVMDAANVDLKGFTEDFYWRLTSGHLNPVLDTLRWLVHESNVWVEITNLIIPRANDNPNELQRMCQWILEELGPDVPLHFTAFHPDFRLTDRGPTPPETLLEAYDIARRAGLNYVYIGNLNDVEHQSTYCPGCGRMVIQRDGYVLGAFDLRDGCCRHCGTRIAGRFDDRAGDWGSRRQPVRIASFAQSGSDPPVVAREDQKQPAAARPPEAVQEPFPQPELNSEQEQRVFRAACRRVASTVLGQPDESLGEILGDAAHTPVYGAFVTLRRAGRLRSCCGFLGQSVTLSQAVHHAAVRAAKDDPRFPPISPSELEHLDVDVWLLWGLQPVTAKGDDRVAAVTIGKHGLQIVRGASRGLLLPGVAVEHNFDARQFLEQVCLKAGLPCDAWKEDDTTLMTFEGRAICGRLELPSAADRRQTVTGPTQADVATLADFCRNNVVALFFGATPSYYLPGGFDGAVCGLAISIGLPESPEDIQCSTLSLRPDKPLQSTLFSLTEAAARILRAHGIDAKMLAAAQLSLSVLLDPAMHGTAAAPELGGIDPQRRALVVIDGARSAWVYDPQRTAEQLLAEAVQLARLPDPAAARVFSMAVVSTGRRVAVAELPHAQAGPELRPPSVAGAFYPADPQQMQSTLTEMFSEPLRPAPWSAALVPHAGWVYSGRLAAATLSRVQIPQRVIMFCPKHRAGGADWAVAPHRTWLLPGAQVESDPELARQLAASIWGLELDAAAHRQEHAIEVQLPLLARIAPHARVVGITIGGGDLGSLQRFGRELAGTLAGLAERPLLVISSDMNHYAGDAETRRLDRLALEAMQTLDPARLYETVTRLQISMCGMLPAVIVLEALRQMDSLHRCELVGYATSAEVSGDTHRVVGYAGMLFG